MIIPWLKKILFVFIIAIAGLWIVVQTPWAQRLIKDSIEHRLRRSGVNCTIHHVDVVFPFCIRLEGLHIKDPSQNNTPLFTCQTLIVSPLFVDLPFHQLSFLQFRGQGICIDADAIERFFDSSAAAQEERMFPFSLAVPFLSLQSVHLKSRHLPHSEGACDFSLKGSLFLSSDQSRVKTTLSISKSTPCSWPKRVDLFLTKKQKAFALNVRTFLSTDGLEAPKKFIFGPDDHLDLKLKATVRNDAFLFSVQSFEKISGTWQLSCPAFSMPFLPTQRPLFPSSETASIIDLDTVNIPSSLSLLKAGPTVDLGFDDYLIRRSASARGEICFVPGHDLTGTCDELETELLVGRTIQAPPDLDGAPEFQSLQFEPIRSLTVKGKGDVHLFAPDSTGVRCQIRLHQLSINGVIGALDGTIDFSLDHDDLHVSTSATGMFSHEETLIPLHCAGTGTIGPETALLSGDLVASQFRLSARYEITGRERSLWTTLRCQDLSLFQPFVRCPCGGSAELSSHLVFSSQKSFLSVSGNVTDALYGASQCKSAAFHLFMGTPSSQHIGLTTDCMGFQMGAYCLDRGAISLSLDSSSQTLRLLEARAIGRCNQCAFDLFASGTGQSDGRHGFLAIDRMEGTVGGDALVLERPLQIEHTGLTLSALSLALGIGQEGRITGQWNRTSLLQGSGDLSLERVPLQHVATSLGLSESFGSFDGQCHYQATASSVIGTAQAQAHIARLGVIGGPEGGIAIGGTLSIDNTIAHAEACIAGMGIKEPLIVQLSAPVTRVPRSPWITISPNSHLNGTMKGDIHLSQLLAGWMPSDAGLEAVIGFDATVSGTVEEPTLSGPVHLRDGRIDLLPTGEVISDISMDGTIDNRRLSVHQISATDDRNGHIEGTGLVEITDANLFRWEASLECSDIEVISLDYASVHADATLKLTGDLSSITISGSAAAKQAVIDLAARFPSNVPEINVTYRDETKEPDSPYNVFFDLSIDASSILEIKGRGLSSQWDGHLHLHGEAEELAVDGLLKCLQGSFTLSTKELTISEGSIFVAGNLFKDSRLHLIANVSLPSITAQVSLKGSLETPKLSIQSTPPKPDNEILSLILFNKEYGDISPLQSLQLANTAMTLQQSSGPFDLLDRVKETFGIDVIDFGASTPSTPSSSSPASGLDDSDTGPPSADVQSDVSLKVGKYISDGVAVTVSKNVTSDTNYLGLEAQVAPEIVAGAEVGDDQEGIVSLKWKKNY